MCRNSNTPIEIYQKGNHDLELSTPFLPTVSKLSFINYPLLQFQPPPPLCYPSYILFSPPVNLLGLLLLPPLTSQLYQLPNLGLYFYSLRAPPKSQPLIIFELLTHPPPFPPPMLPVLTPPPPPSSLTSTSSSNPSILLFLLITTNHRSPR